jgi:hypothetical protein
MRTALVSLGALLLAVLANFLSSELSAWVEALARWIVRRQARKMGDRASRCTEEWLADLDQKPGSIAKLYSAVTLLRTPWLTLIEQWRDRYSRTSVRFALVWLRDWSGLAVVGALSTLIGLYPPNWGRLAAYAFLIPFLTLCGLYLLAPFRRLFVEGYDRCNHGARVSIGGLAVPFVVYSSIALSLIPPNGPAQETIRTGPLSANRPAFIVEFASMDTISGVGKISESRVRVHTSGGDRRSHEKTEDMHPAYLLAASKNVEFVPIDPSLLPTLRHPARVEPDQLMHSKSMEIPLLARQIGVEEIDLSKLPTLPLPQQPIHIQPRVVGAPTPPSAPTNVRIMSL